jgi:hypothetical protein
MANNFRVPPRNYVLAVDLPTSGAGSAAGDAVVSKGLVGINAWGTGKGQGIPAGSSYGMLAVDGTAVLTVNISVAAVKEGDPIYITSAHAVNNVASGNTLLGYADEPGAIGAATKIGVRIKSQVNV